MSDPISIGVIGCGGISQMMHLPFLWERPDLFRVVALADTNPQVLEAMGRRHHVDRLHGDYRRLLEEPVEAVLIASGGSHRDPVIDALAAGKHVFTEKPLGENLQEVEAIARVAEATDRVLMVGYHKRYDPGYRHAREEVRRLRDLRWVRCEVLHPVDARARDHYVLEPPKDPDTKAREDREETDGLTDMVLRGAARENVEAIVGPEAPACQKVSTFLLFNSLIHDVNALRGILGEPEEVLFSEFWRGGRGMHVVLRWPGDVRGTLSWVYLPGLRHYREELFFASPESRVTLTFPSPYYRHFPTPVRVESMVDGRFEGREVIVSLDEAFRLELHHFHECVRTGRRPETDLQDALADTRLLEAIARAWRP
ncbi:MAG TPA: Gfo/Idh/MocA family oxidoreductase [Myxococcota bacterium]|nr:Gfo/Idh/MocA family oxidoreductase [Myxococcota bacterium]HQK51680.1 Gfo/Idh/MocA family oxidoreductase [Myxococcota bacterium]